MTTWFTSDLHFGHKNIIKYCARPWTADAAGVEAMNEALVENWNRVVQPKDTVWNLGDTAFCCAPAKRDDYLRRLNGAHHLLFGNHDDAMSTLVAQAEGWYSSTHHGYVEIEVEDQAIVMCHYPMRSWHHCQRGVWHLFGHVHGLLRPHGKSVDVGVDNVDEILGVTGRDLGARKFGFIEDTAARRALYRPVSFAELKAFMETRPVGPHEEFGDGFAPSGTKEGSQCQAP